MSEPRKVLIVGGPHKGRIVTELNGERVLHLRHAKSVALSSFPVCSPDELPPLTVEIHIYEIHPFCGGEYKNPDHMRWLAAPPGTSPLNVLDELIATYAETHKANVPVLPGAFEPSSPEKETR